MSALALSVVLSFVSAVAYAGGAIIQEQVAVTSPGQTYAPLRRPGWWAAVALTGLGGLLHVVALAFGPLSLVQPLGALTIVFALPMAALFVGRKAGAGAWRGAIMATVGLAGLLSLVGASDAQSLSHAQRLALGVVSGGAVAALMVAGRAAHRHPAVRSVLLAVAAGVAFSMSSVFTKTVAVDWSEHVSLADLSSLAAIGVFATAGMLISQASYRGAGLEAPLATLTVVNPVVAAAVGITMFGETFRYGTAGTALALGCGVVAAGGLILLTTERIAGGDRPVAAAPKPTAAPEADAGRSADAAHPHTADHAPVTFAAPSEPRLAEPAVSRPRVAEPAVPADAGAGALTATEAAVAELLAGLPEPGEDADGLVVPASPAGIESLAARTPASPAGIESLAAQTAGGVPQASRAGGDGVFPPGPRAAAVPPQPAIAAAFVPAPAESVVPAAPAREVVAPRPPAGGDELPYLTVMLGVPYVPIPFVSHHRTRVKS
ncbi:DMT family transporter [Streptomyces sp. NPDC026665]|uniref:DMT family transporter n=1 Tax=Streptomyces sp. NPDC026665 TaxID=3154798 RepID=UPI003409BEC0